MRTDIIWVLPPRQEPGLVFPKPKLKTNCLTGPTFSFQMIFMAERRPQSMKIAPGVLMLLLGTQHRKTQHDVLFNAGVAV
jgi:hypothetical protein